jgi:integrase
VIDTMPRPRLPYTSMEVTRHGQTIWYVRRPGRRKVRLKAVFGTPEFMAAYQAAMSDEEAPQPVREAAGTLSWLIARYRGSTAWADLSGATRRQRENIFKGVLAKAGDTRLKAVTQAAIVKGRDNRKETPAQARNFLDAMRGLFRWAHEAQLVDVDPTAGVKNPKKRTRGGFPVWTEADIAAYERRWPIGTKERVWLDVLLYTGLRRGDAVRIGRQHISSDGFLSIRTEKSGQKVEVSIPILPVLAATLKAGPTGDLAFICGATKKPLTKESFGNFFSAAARAAGIKKGAHGVRKIAATRCAENGATVSELEAMFGWTGGGMASLYTRAADRKRLSHGAASKLNRNGEATSIVQLEWQTVQPIKQVPEK